MARRQHFQRLKMISETQASNGLRKAQGGNEDIRGRASSSRIERCLLRRFGRVE